MASRRVDSRAYVTVYHPGVEYWAWVAVDQEYESELFPIEDWTHDKYPGHRWTLNRACYTKGRACQWIERVQQRKFGMMEGPDVFVVVDEVTKQRIMTVWHVPFLGNQMEISIASGPCIKVRVDNDSLKEMDEKDTIKALLKSQLCELLLKANQAKEVGNDETKNNNDNDDKKTTTETSIVDRSVSSNTTTSAKTLLEGLKVKQYLKLSWHL